jgi:hypothetical protein
MNFNITFRDRNDKKVEGTAQKSKLSLFFSHTIEMLPPFLTLLVLLHPLSLAADEF